MHIKYMNAWSNNSFDMLLTLLKDTFAICRTMPNSNYEAKKTISSLGLYNDKIDAYQNDCIIYCKNIQIQLNV